MKSILMAILGIIVGFVVAFALVIGVEYLSSIVHPVPGDFKGTMEEMCLHVARYPHWVLGAVVLVWGATGLVSVWVATRIGSTPAGVVLALLLIAAVVFNVVMLPYALWFKVVMPVGMVMGCVAGLRYGRPRIAVTTDVPPSGV